MNTPTPLTTVGKLATAFLISASACIFATSLQAGVPNSFTDPSDGWYEWVNDTSASSFYDSANWVHHTWTNTNEGAVDDPTTPDVNEAEPNWVLNAPVTGEAPPADAFSRARIGIDGANVLINTAINLKGELAFDAGKIVVDGGQVTQDEWFWIMSQTNGTGAGEAEFTLRNGGTWHAKRITIGDYGHSANVLITGAGSKLSSSGYLITGTDNTTANITIAAGGILEKIGTGQELIFSDGSGTSTVNVASGGTIQSAADIKVGWGNGNASITLGEADVDGSSGFINVTDSKYLYIGRTNNENSSNTGNSGIVTLYNASKINVGGEIWVGGGKTSNGRLILNDTAEVTARQVHVAVKQATGYLELNDNSKLAYGSSESVWGLQNSGNATVVMNNNASVSGGAALSIGKETGTGHLTMNDDTKITVGSGTLSIGYKNAESRGTLIMNDNSEIVISSGAMEVGRENANANAAEGLWGGYVELNTTKGITLNNQSLVISSPSARARVVLNGNENGGSKITGVGEINFQNDSTKAQLELNGTSEISADRFILRGKASTITLNDSTKITLSGTGQHKLIDGKDYDNVVINVNNNAQFIDAGTVVIGHNQGNETGTTAKATVNVGDGTGTALFQADRIVLGRSDSTTNAAIAELNINAGGTVATNTIEWGGGAIATKTLNANGGTIRALSNQSEFFADRIHNENSVKAGTATYNILAGGLTFDTQAFNVTTARDLSGAGTLTKIGTGTLSLNGNFAGTTVVKAGTLGGTGTLGNITVKSGATLAPGNSVGTLTAGNVTLEAGATLVLEYEAGNIDQLVADSVTFAEGSTLFIDLNGGTLAQGDTLQLFGISTAVAGLTAEKIQISDGTYAFTFNATNGVITVVPEPSTYALLGAAGLLGLVALRRRKNRPHA